MDTYLTAVFLLVKDLIINSENKQIYGSDGEEVEVNCNLSIPISSTRLSLIYNKSIISSEMASSLTSYYNVSLAQHGHHVKCLANIINKNISVETTTRLNITYKPLVQITSLPDRRFLKGDNVSLTCLNESNPDATKLTWTKDGKLLSTEMVLYINGIDESDSGTYTCSVYNSIGTGVNYTNVTIRYVPEMPMKFSVQPLSAGFRCSWVPGDNGFLPQSFYVAYRESHSSKWITSRPIKNATSFEVKGLLPDTDFDVIMYAQNDNGESNYTRIIRFRSLLSEKKYGNGLAIYILSTFGLTVILLFCAALKHMLTRDRVE